MVNYTNDDVILYIHNEMPAAQLIAFENALANDWSLQEKVNLLSTTINYLPKTTLLSPSTRTINSIMAYATKNIAEKV
jgi:hypothetical protein